MRLSAFALSLFLLSTAPLASAQEPAAKPAPAAAKPAPATATPAPAPAAAPAAGASTAAPKAKKAGATGIMDINTASVDELKTLPGVTDEIAAKIVAGRPYKGKDALLKQNMVDKDTYAKLRPLIVAKQPKAPKADKAAAPATPPAK